MAKAIALIVAGSGDTSPDEVADLLNEAYPEDEYEVDLVIPVGKDHYTTSVKNVVDWLDDPEYVLPVLFGEEKQARGTDKFGDPVELAGWSEVFDPSEFEDRDEVHFLLAVPDEDDDDNFDKYVEVAEIADAAGFQIKNLTAALDDVVMTDPEDEAEPEPEEKPAKRSRKKKAEPAEDVPEDPPGDSAEEQAEVARAAVTEDPWKSTEDRSNDHLLTVTRNLIEALQDFEQALKPQPKPEEPEVDPEEPKEAPKRGRGRPRTNFEVKQIWDEDEQEWVKRPKGRVRKGTKYRTFNTETEEVTDEGTV